MHAQRNAADEEPLAGSATESFDVELDVVGWDVATADGIRRSYGTGSLYPKKLAKGGEVWYGKWRVNDVQVKRRIGPKRMAGSLGGTEGLTKRDAEAALRELMMTLTPADVGAASKTPGRSIEDVSNAYIASRTLKESTTDDYVMVVRVHLRPFFGDRSVNSIRSEEIEDLIALMQSKGLAPKTVHNYMMSLTTYLNYGVKKGWLRRSPMDSIDIPPKHATGEEEPLRFLTVQEVHDLAAAVKPGEYELLDRALYFTAALTGMRQGELRGLRWDQIDTSGSSVRVQDNIVRSRSTTPKSKKFRTVPMASALAVALEELRAVSHYTGPDQPVFATPSTGNPISRTQLMKRYKRAVKAAGLGDFRFHDLRHTFGTSMAMAGEPVTSIQAWLGHADLATTMRYMHYAPRGDEAARIDKAFAIVDPRSTNLGTNMSTTGVPESTEQHGIAA